MECAVRFPKNLKNLNSFLREYYSSVYIIIQASRSKALKSPSDKKNDDHLDFFNASGEIKFKLDSAFSFDKTSRYFAQSSIFSNYRRIFLVN